MNQLPSRALGAAEKRFWLLDQTNSVHFVTAAEIAGVVDPVTLQKALVAIQRRHPLFASRIVPNDYAHPYFEHAPGAHIPLKVLNGAGHFDLAGVIAQELATPMDADALPLARFTLVKQAARSIIVATVHHAISDGISMTIVFRDLLEALNGATLEASPLPPSIDQLTGHDTGEIVLKQVTPLQFQHVPHTVPHVHLRAVDRERTAAIVQKCRAEGTTFYGALYAATIRAARAAGFPWSGQQIKVMAPIAVRDTLTTDTSSAAYTHVAPLIAQPEDSLDFWELARKTRQQLLHVHDADVVHNACGMARQVIFKDNDVPALVAGLQQGLLREMMITNLGNFRYPITHGALRLEGLWVVVLLNTPNEITMGISTVNGQLCITMATPMKAPHFLDQVIGEMEAAIDL